MNTKKISLILILLFAITLPGMAQGSRYNRSSDENGYDRFWGRWFNYDREVYYGLRLGLAVSTVKSDDASLDGGGGKSGLNLGVIAGIQLTPATPIYLESGLLYVTKGGKNHNGGKKFTYDLNYLEVPIVAKYKHFFSNEVSLQPFFGGYFALGVGGKVKDYHEEIAYDSFSDDYFQRFDGGLRLGCGIAYQNFYVDMRYDFGLSNIGHDAFKSTHNRCFYLTLGVDF